MMLPLWTSVTDGRRRLMACWMAFAISRCEPNFDIGLMPMALPSRIFAPNLRVRNSMTESASELCALYSMPA